MVLFIHTAPIRPVTKLNEDLVAAYWTRFNSFYFLFLIVVAKYVEGISPEIASIAKKNVMEKILWSENILRNWIWEKNLLWKLFLEFSILLFYGFCVIFYTLFYGKWDKMIISSWHCCNWLCFLLGSWGGLQLFTIVNGTLTSDSLKYIKQKKCLLARGTMKPADTLLVKITLIPEVNLLQNVDISTKQTFGFFAWLQTDGANFRPQMCSLPKSPCFDLLELGCLNSVGILKANELSYVGLHN